MLLVHSKGRKGLLCPEVDSEGGRLREALLRKWFEQLDIDRVFLLIQCSAPKKEAVKDSCCAPKETVKDSCCGSKEKAEDTCCASDEEEEDTCCAPKAASPSAKVCVPSYSIRHRITYHIRSQDSCCVSETEDDDCCGPKKTVSEVSSRILPIT